MPSPAAQRQRRYRERARAGTVVVSVQVTAAGIETLIELGWLPAWDADDREAVGAAISAFVERVTRNAFDDGDLIASNHD